MGFSPSTGHQVTTSIFSNIVDAETGSFVSSLTVSGVPVDIVGFNAGALKNVVEDTTPQLGGTLDAQDNNITNVDVLTIGTLNATTGLGSQLSAQTFDIIEVGHLTTENGTVGIPSHSFVNDSQLGMFRVAANRLGFTSNGILRAEVTASGIEIPAGLALTISGVEVVAGPHDGGEVNTGANVGGSNGEVFREKVGEQLRFRTLDGGNNVIITNNSFNIEIAVPGPLKVADGSAAIPTYAFTNDFNIGMFRVAENRLGFTADGVLRATVTTSGLEVNNGDFFASTVTSVEQLNLAPRTNTQKDAVSTPVAGSTLFNTTSGTVNVYDGTSWRELAYI